jgi:hypothetical protein
MPILAGIVGALIVVLVLWDAFEAIVLPRRVMRTWRLTRFFYRSTWRVWSAAARHVRAGKRRETGLSFYGPLSLLMLLSVWAMTMVVGFALVQWALGSQLSGQNTGRGFLWDLYFSGSTFFTLGLGDLTPQDAPSRIATVLEAGIGFGFLAMVIGYLPIIYQSFSRREVEIALMDARAGSPSAAVELLVRQSRSGNFAQTTMNFLAQWERWSSELLESHLSYPLLAYYRSQHDNQSWLAALTTVLDVCALVLVGGDGPLAWQAQLTFAIARHAVVDLSQVFSAAPKNPHEDRLPPEDFARAAELLAGAGIPFNMDGSPERKLAALRQMYEPYVNSLSVYLMMKLPPWLPGAKKKENWLTSAWEHATVPPQMGSTRPSEK